MADSSDEEEEGDDEAAEEQFYFYDGLTQLPASAATECRSDTNGDHRQQCGSPKRKLGRPRHFYGRGLRMS